jgi:hypothetical protein
VHIDFSSELLRAESSSTVLTFGWHANQYSKTILTYLEDLTVQFGGESGDTETQSDGDVPPKSILIDATLGTSTTLRTVITGTLSALNGYSFPVAIELLSTATRTESGFSVTHSIQLASAELMIAGALVTPSYEIDDGKLESTDVNPPPIYLSWEALEPSYLSREGPDLIFHPNLEQVAPAAFNADAIGISLETRFMIYVANGVVLKTQTPTFVPVQGGQ